MATHVDFRGKTTTYTYDLRDHLLTTVPDPSLGEPTVTFTFNASGTRATMADASGASVYTYDLRDRLLTKATPAGTLTYTYDPSGNVATIRSSNANGTSVDYAWDAANQLASVTDNRIGGITTAAYSATGRPSLVTQPSGVAASYGYDSLDRVTSMTWRKAPASVFASWAYGLNQRGQRLTATDVTGRTATYGYDAVARLASETITGDPQGAVGNGAITYSVDPTGNRLSRASTLAGIPSTTYTYDGNDQLATDGYDPNGNTTSGGGNTYAYDFANRLVSKNAGAVTMTYDGDGNRVAKSVGGVTTKYLVDDLNPTGYLQVLEEVPSGTVQIRYTYGSMVVSQTRQTGGTSQTTFYGYDAHGNVIFLTDATGAVTDTYDYDAFGDIMAITGSTPNTRLFAGEEVDPDVGLINLRARQYVPDKGRFLMVDPLIGDPQVPVSFNSYLYANADPVNLKDPLGLATAAEGGILNGIPTALIREVVFTAGKGAAIGGSVAVLGRAVACADLNEASDLAAAVSGEQSEQEPIRALAGVLGCGKWTCESRCSVAANTGYTKDISYRVSAQGRGTTRFAACAVAEKACQNSTPRGFRTVHCDKCQKYKNCWRG